MILSRTEDYKSKVIKGYEKMRTQKVAICSTVRDCAKSLRRNISKVENLRKYFLESYVVVVENDSKDNSKYILNRWSKDSKNVTIISGDSNVRTIQKRCPDGANPFFSAHRIQLMAGYRNQYMDFLEETPHVEFVIVVDLDVYSISIDGIANTFGQPVKWHAVGSNGRNIFRKDIGILFHFWKGYVYFDTYAFREFGDERPQNEEMIYTYQTLLKPLKKGMPMIRVASSFGGLAVYTYDAIAGIRYDCEKNDDRRVTAESEHVFFHKQMAAKNHDRIYLNPSQTIYYDTYTNYIKAFPCKLMQRIFSR